MRKFTEEEYKERIYNKNKNIELIRTYTKPYGNKGKSQTYCDCVCKIDGHEFTSSYGNLYDGKGCPVCSRKVLHASNMLATIRPDLIEYLKYKEDAYNNFPSSKVRVMCKCPICGSEKHMPLNNLARQGFSCDRCSDNISIPEKFVFGILECADIDFNTQKIFSWSQRKKYDFYIPNLNIIIETHGEQHYRHTGLGRSLKEEQENDQLKYELAIKNGIKPENYIVIDCRHSTFDWLKDNCIIQLENIFDLSNINFEKIFADSQISIVPKIWEAWNLRGENDSTYEFSKIFKINRNAITNYLKIGNDLGKCKYDPKEESKKGIDRSNKISRKAVLQYSLEGELLQEFVSIAEASKVNNIFDTNISRCCLGKQVQSGGFIWKYKSNSSEDGIVKQEKKDAKF